MKQKNDNKKGKGKGPELLIFAALLIIIILSSVLIIRLIQDKPVFPAGESYHNLRIAQQLNKDLFSAKEPLQNTPKMFSVFNEPNPYHYFLAFLFVVFPVKLVYLFFPLILGLLSCFLFFRLLVSLGVLHKHSAYAIMILSVSPAFIILFTGFYLAGFVVLLSTLAVLLGLHNKKAWQFIGILVFLILALTSLTGFVLTLMAFLFICLIHKKRLNMFFTYLAVPALIIIFFTLLSGYTLKFLGFHSFAFKNILSILGADIGFDLFLVVLFITGFVVVWIKEKQKKLFHLLIVFLFILSFFNMMARVFASFIITVYCVFAITYFFNRKWELNVIKAGTFLLVLCTLVFSVTSQANSLVNSQPDEAMQIALSSLYTFGDGRVLTSEEYGSLVEFYSEKNTLLDFKSIINPDYSKLKKDSNALFSAARLKEAEPLFKEYDLRYVLITPSMKEELWAGREQGLWFLVKHSESFIKKYEQSGIEIWEYESS